VLRGKVCVFFSPSVSDVIILFVRSWEQLLCRCVVCAKKFRSFIVSSGAGTNLKFVGTRLARIFFVSLRFFGSSSTISRLSERFRDGQYSLVSFFVCCSSIHGAPPSHL